MSFTINFKAQEPIRDDTITKQLFEFGLPGTDPNFSKQLRYMTFLCTQINQISGMNSDYREQDVSSFGGRGLPSAEGFCALCNNLSTAHVNPGMQPIVRGFLSDFEAAAGKGCKICQLVLAAVSPYEGPGRLKAYIRPGGALNILLKSSDKNARYDSFTEIGG
jgi:hypothetical protein